MLNEIWKPIKGYEDRYEVSNMGDINSFKENDKMSKFFSSKKLKPGVSKSGYKIVVLYKNKVSKSFYVHRLVAISFLENPEQKPIVNHIDEDKLNNKVENLQWVTVKENINHGNAQLKRIRSTYKTIFQYDKNMNIVKEWDSISECIRNGFDGKTITDSLKNVKQEGKEFSWSYDYILKLKGKFQKCN